MDTLKKALNTLPLEGSWAGLREVTISTTILKSQKGEIQPFDRAHDHGYRLEILHEGQFVYAGFQDLTDIHKAYTRALNLAQSIQSYKVGHFGAAQRPHIQGKYTHITQLLPSDIQECAHVLQVVDKELMKSSLVVYSHAYLHLQNIETAWCTTEGTEITQASTLFAYDIQGMGSNGTLSQKRSLGTSCFQGDPHKKIHIEALKPHSQRLAQQISELLHAENCPEGERDLLLHPDQLYLQVHESIGHPLELDRILGDERNYAGWSFITLKDFGNLRYGSPLMNVTFDPTDPYEMATYAFDDSGLRATKTHLIRNGILECPLGGSESQIRSGLKGVANARSSSWNRPPLDRMANINLEPSNTTLSELITETEKGIYMQTNTSWSIDDYRRNFQFGCEYAQLIENGQLTKVVRNPNYRGSTLDFWNKLKAVGNDPTVWGSLYCGKGEPNQIIQVGHTVPHALFENITVFGGL